VESTPKPAIEECIMQMWELMEVALKRGVGTVKVARPAQNNGRRIPLGIGLEILGWLWSRAVLTSVVVVATWWAGASAASPPAFPGAQGFGALASGGRGGMVYYVTNLNDHGPGSLRDAVARGNRMVLFKVSGTIDLETRIDVEASNLTIAGETAPGDGLCIRDRDVIIKGNDIIIRFLRFRPGDRRRDEHDALTLWGAHRVIVDHCSMSWSTDSLNDVVKGSGDITVQWCILSEPLNHSIHEKGAHGYATGWGSDQVGGGGSYHHNLIAHANSRAPRIGDEAGTLVDVRNNVIYDTGGGNAYGGEEARINYVANYVKPGLSSRHPNRIFLVGSHLTRMFLDGNVVEGSLKVTRDNTAGLSFENGARAAGLLVHVPFSVPAVSTQPAERAYTLVLKHAGALLPARDLVDVRIVQSVLQGIGRVIDSQDEVGGWPELQSAPAPADTDGDGLPDRWERDHALDPRDPADGTRIAPGDYTMLELYLHDLAARTIGAR
jgi:pectate lyase